MRRLWDLVEPANPGDLLSKAVDVFILSLITLNLVDVVIRSHDDIYGRYSEVIDLFETVSLIVFTVEYLARLVSCIADPRYSALLWGRVRFALTPMALIDLAAILPILMPFVGADFRYLRVLRLLRLLRLLKLLRYVNVLRIFANVIRAKREELLVATVCMALLLVISSCLMYQVEHTAQPESFPNIPATMWWAVATLTTVGYGDILPITPAGKLIGAVVAVLGIAFFALPTGILGSGFVEEIQSSRSVKKCPQCGELL